MTRFLIKKKQTKIVVTPLASSFFLTRCYIIYILYRNFERDTIKTIKKIMQSQFVVECYNAELDP